MRRHVRIAVAWRSNRKVDYLEGTRKSDSLDPDPSDSVNLMEKQFAQVGIKGKTHKFLRLVLRVKLLCAQRVAPDRFDPQ